MERGGSIARGCLVLLAAAAGAPSLACDDDQGPRLEIISPAAGERVELGNDMRVDVDIFVRDFKIDSAADCAGETDACGQVLLNIDGAACNAPGFAYNAILDRNRNEIEADFSFCPVDQRLGNHTITVALLGQGGQPVATGGGPVSTSITVFTEP
jgi:hypothetical protein